MLELQARHGRLDEAIEAVDNIYHLVGAFQIFEEQKCDRLLHRWLECQATDIVLATLEDESTEFRFVRKNLKGSNTCCENE